MYNTFHSIVYNTRDFRYSDKKIIIAHRPRIIVLDVNMLSRYNSQMSRLRMTQGTSNRYTEIVHKNIQINEEVIRHIDKCEFQVEAWVS